MCELVSVEDAWTRGFRLDDAGTLTTAMRVAACGLLGVAPVSQTLTDRPPVRVVVLGVLDSRVGVALQVTAVAVCGALTSSVHPSAAARVGTRAGARRRERVDAFTVVLGGAAGPGRQTTGAPDPGAGAVNRDGGGGPTAPYGGAAPPRRRQAASRPFGRGTSDRTARRGCGAGQPPAKRRSAVGQEGVRRCRVRRWPP